ncbi:response regulator [Halosolutus halophilus]|uniref:response regulator n=1 Tax=Halosolutus halophilus TaxID=1552990 RepID=UPI00223505D5|nr:response regulator [Halosolutus halophilus]
MDNIDILLVEDNHGDIHLIEQVFEDRDLLGELHSVQTGEEALDWLYRRDEFAETPRPELVLLDLNLPAASGQTVLEEIKSDPRLKRIPVVVLTGSESEDDLIRAYEAYANAYLLKPVDPDEFADRIQAVVEFWLFTATLPPVSADDNDQ